MKIVLTLILAIVVVALATYLVWEILPLSSKTPKISKPEITPETPVTAQALKVRQKIHSLAARKQRSDIPEFKKHLKDKSPMVRLAAAKAIYDVGGKEELHALVEVLKDPDRSVRAGILQFLGQWRDPRLIPHLAELLRTDKEISVRLLALDALSKINDESRIPALIAALRDDRFIIRKKAHEALRAITSEKVDLDDKVLKDKPEEAYSKWHGWWQGEQVERHFSHTGVKQLEKRNDAESVDLLVKIPNTEGIKPDSKSVKAAAVVSLCRMTCPEAKEAFERILVDTSKEPLNLAAINAVVACKRKEYLPNLKELSKSAKSVVIREKAAWAIDHLKRTE